MDFSADDRDVDSSDLPTVWKLFSSEPLEEDALDAYFHVRRETRVVDWLDSPSYGGRETKESLGNMGRRRRRSSFMRA